MAWIRAFTLLAFIMAIAARESDAARPTARDLAVPRYEHIFVIMEENKDYGAIIGSKDAPTITRLAHEYGFASEFYAETHPSEPNYVALIGGYTYGIQDDDAYYCKPRDDRAHCEGSRSPGFVSHTIVGPNLGTQLEARGLTWKNYNESLPEPGSLAVYARDPRAKDAPADLAVYASKHSGFMNFASVLNDPQRAEKIVGFDQFRKDLRTGLVPNFSFVIPNLCDEMHGTSRRDTPPDCTTGNMSKLIWRGDQNVGEIVGEIIASAVWKSKENTAIVITFDEDEHYTSVGCCGNDPHDPSNLGGGHIATIVVTNHGPRHVIDSTPYSHYALLRTIEDAFGIREYLRRANAPGVVPMLPLFGLETVPTVSRSAGETSRFAPRTQN
jgi:phospholipase C